MQFTAHRKKNRKRFLTLIVKNKRALLNLKTFDSCTDAMAGPANLIINFTWSKCHNIVYSIHKKI